MTLERKPRVRRCHADGKPTVSELRRRAVATQKQCKALTEFQRAFWRIPPTIQPIKEACPQS